MGLTRGAKWVLAAALVTLVYDCVVMAAIRGQWFVAVFTAIMTIYATFEARLVARVSPEGAKAVADVMLAAGMVLAYAIAAL